MLVVIVGHKNCGGVVATHKRAFPNSPDEEGQSSDGIVLEPLDDSEQSRSAAQNALNRWLTPLVNHLTSFRPITLERAHMENVRMQVDNLLTYVEKRYPSVVRAASGCSARMAL